MAARVRTTSILRTVAALAMLGFATTSLVTAALGAWLPNRGLSARTGYVRRYPDSHLRGFWQLPTGQLVRVYFARISRPGMERRSWCRLLPGVTDMEHTIYSWHSVHGHIASVTRRDDAPEPHEQWGGLGSCLRGAPLPRDRATEDARGWPCLAAWCEIKQRPGGPCTVSGGLRLLSDQANVATVRCIPLRPIWRGIAINTTFYAAFWLIPLAAWPLIRATSRRRRGLCPSCAYDLCHDFSAGCPECGWRR